MSNPVAFCRQAQAAVWPKIEYVDPSVWAVEDYGQNPNLPILTTRAQPPTFHPPVVTPSPIVAYSWWTSADALWWTSLLRANSEAGGDDTFVQRCLVDRATIEGYHFQWAGPQGIIPTVFWCRMVDRFVVGVNGTENANQAVNFFLTHSVGRQRQVAGGWFNTTFATSAQALYSYVNADFTAAGRPPLLIMGHSYGGGVAHPLYALLRQGNPLEFDRLVTCGAPKAVTTSSTGLFTGLQAIRFCNAGDPVTLLPPPQAMTLAAHLTPVAGGYPGGDYVPIGARLEPQTTGGIVPVPDPTLATADWLGAMSSFILNANGPEPHFARQYAGRMRTWATNSPGQNRVEYRDFNDLFAANAAMAAAGF